jgi:phosphoserine phosphatase RsbU/P
MHKLALAFLLMGGMVASQPRHTQSAQATPPVIRYHYGDNPAWASPSFNDGAWPVAANGSWSVPVFQSDGFVWIRALVPVSVAASADLAVRITGVVEYSGPEQVFVNGRDVGSKGGFPPLGTPVYSPPSAVFILPHGTAAPGSMALVAVRFWYVPAWRIVAIPSHLRIRISNADTAELAQHAAFLSNALSLVPDLALNTLLALVGVGLFVFWFRIRRAELLWCAALLIFYPLLQWFWDATHPDYFFIPCREYALLWVLFILPSMVTTVEFIWTVHRLHARAWRRAAHLAWIVYNTAFIVALSSFQPSSFVRWSATAIFVSVQAFNAITLGANLWVLFVRRYNRAIAAAMCVIPLASGISIFGWQADWRIGTVSIGLFDVGFLLSGFAIAVMLIRRALAAWRQSDQLRVEFAAAREVQQRLVPISLPAVHRFRLGAAYLPSAEVGGDFYQVLPQSDDSALIVIGDVSGKGLKAAMTGTLVLGALRTLAQENLSPSQILFRLTNQLAMASDGGFVTCLCARILGDGTLTLANAGHLAPYRNGEEVSLDSGLPLGITADTTYPESTLRLAPSDRLTFLSDGVPEARNPTGELFGFERTRSISTESAEDIARAAQDFGQEDDITVLTLSFAPVEALHA